MTDVARARPAFKVWLETDEGYMFGPGVYSLLRKIDELGTLKEAAESLGMSYRYAWGLLKKAENKLGRGFLKTHKGGRAGGGGAELTQLGRRFLEEYSMIDDSRTGNRLEALVEKIVREKDKVRVTLTLNAPASIHISVPKRLFDEREIASGARVWVELNSYVGDMARIDQR